MSATTQEPAGDRPQPARGPALHLDPIARRNLLGGPGRTRESLLAQDQLPREVAYAALKDGAALGYESVVIEGGEPLLYDALPGLLARARRLELHSTLVTNGTLLGQARRWAPIARLIDCLVVEIHGDEATHDAVVVREGAYAQTVANLTHPRAAGVPFLLGFTLTDANAEDLAPVLRLAAEQGAVGVRVRHLPSAAGAPGGLSADQVACLEAAGARAARLGLELDTGVVGQDELVLYRGRFVPRFPAREVTSLAPVLRIEADGRVLPISGGMPSRLGIGSLHRRRLTALVGAWLVSNRASQLAEACDRAWWSLVDPGSGAPVAWETELARHAADAPATRELDAVAA